MTEARPDYMRNVVALLQEQGFVDEVGLYRDLSAENFSVEELYSWGRLKYALQNIDIAKLTRQECADLFRDFYDIFSDNAWLGGFSFFYDDSLRELNSFPHFVRFGDKFCGFGLRRGNLSLFNLQDGSLEEGGVVSDDDFRALIAEIRDDVNKKFNFFKSKCKVVKSNAIEERNYLKNLADLKKLNERVFDKGGLQNSSVKRLGVQIRGSGDSLALSGVNDGSQPIYFNSDHSR